ncbi:MAG: hypothetical protein IJG45_02345 [Oscillospiraceae bacterium]|nr:hypothetical protein [Oscillospiraceae bacterium]
MDKVQLSRNIYSFIVELYCYLSREKEQLWKKEYELFCNKQTDVLKKVRAITDTIPYATRNDFFPWKKEWVSVFHNNIAYSASIIFQTLKNFDDLIPDLFKQSKKVVISHGPLNDYREQEGFLYVASPASYLTAMFEKNHIRKGRQTVSAKNTALSTSFSHYFVVERSLANKYIPIVNCYNKSIFTDGRIKICCCPFSRETWINTKAGSSGEYFRVEYDNANEVTHNNRIIDLIRYLDEQGANIVTFPELVLNNRSLWEIKSFLLHAELHNLKLIFTGSNWNNDELNNISYIISRDGTVLLKHQKKVGYKYYSHESNQYIIEDLDPDAFLSFLDIPGLGRTVYNICADYNDDLIQLLCSSLMETDMYFIAAFTPDTYLMLERAKSNAVLKGETTILTNACAAAKDDQAISFVVKPLVESRHLLSDQVVFMRKKDCTSCGSNNKNCEILQISLEMESNI